MSLCAKLVIDPHAYTDVVLYVCNCNIKCSRDCLTHPPQGTIEQPGPLSDPHIAIATTAWPLRYEQCDRADEAG